MAVVFANQIIKNGETYTFVFEQNLINAAAFVQGYQFSYNDNDNHIRKEIVRCEITNINAASVTVKATCQANDDSGNNATGTINVTCVGEI